ncbi:MAG: hypothetical protein ACI8PZ_005068 [Myxococcota bacterium]|jgi:hypothetical protein
MLLTLALAALAAECPDPAVVVAPTAWEADRAWIHPPNWFAPLTDPGVVPLKDQTAWPADGTLLTVEVGGEVKGWPLQALAYHHVANDIVGGEPIAVTY